MAAAPAAVAMVPVVLSTQLIVSAIKNIYITQLTQIGGIVACAVEPTGLINTMKTPWDVTQFRRLATAVAVPGTAIAAPLPGSVPPAVPAPWGDYANIDYTNVVAVGGASAARDKVRMATLQCDLRAPGDLLLLLTSIFNGQHMILGNKMIFNVPKSDQLLLHFIAPLAHIAIGMRITVDTPGGIPPTDQIVAAALLPYMISPNVLQGVPGVVNLYIDLLGITPEQKAAFTRYDSRVELIRNGLM